MPDSVVIGSRGSQLALWQAHWIQSRLKDLGVASSIQIIKTTGDKITDVPLSQVGSKGLFTKEIEEALLDGSVDLAVHSMKDLPTEVPAGLVVAAVPEREDPRDALVGSTLADLPEGARVGTSSLRRSAQLRALRPDLQVESLRGNLDTRLRKLDEGQFAAIMLAAAGLRRLGWADRMAEVLPPDIFIPAVAQGALAIETRADGGFAHQICAKLDHPDTRTAVLAERALLGGLGGGCQVPIGAHARLSDGQLHLIGLVIDPGSLQAVRLEQAGDPAGPELLGASLARTMLDAGGRAVLRSVYGESAPLIGKRIVVTRARHQAAELSSRLRGLGAAVIELPAIELLPAANLGPLDSALRRLDSYQWLVFTSVNAVSFFCDRRDAVLGSAASYSGRVCAIGSTTRDALRARGFSVDLVPDQFVAESAAQALSGAVKAGDRVLMPRAAVARDVIPAQLAELGAVVDVVEVYRTIVPSDLAETAARQFAMQGKPDWITLTSSSTVKNFLAAIGQNAFEGVRVASIGPVTSDVARRHGLTVDAEASPSTMDGLVEAILQASR